MKTITNEACTACEGTRYMATGEPGDRLQPCKICQGTGKKLIDTYWPVSYSTAKRWPSYEEEVLALVHGRSWRVLAFVPDSPEHLFTDDDGNRYGAEEVSEWKRLPPIK